MNGLGDNEMSMLDERNIDLFISYSRSNLDFVRRLAEALALEDKEPWFDQRVEPLYGLPAGSPWWQEIKEGIRSAENFVFIVSEKSVESPFCHAEIAYALEQGKRIIPVFFCHPEAVNKKIDSRPR